MENKALEKYSEADVFGILKENVSSVIMVDTVNRQYRVLLRNTNHLDAISDEGSVDDLFQVLWFHFADSNKRLTNEYTTFLSYQSDYKGIYTRRIRLMTKEGDSLHYFQLTVYPIKDYKKYVYTLDEISDEYVQEDVTAGKVDTAIQNTFLYSMYVDLAYDSVRSMSVTEISEDVMNIELKYSEWRLTTVNMIWPEDQQRFLQMTDPDYLRANLSRGRTATLDCQMQNLEGVYIWVKLIFSRTQTSNEDDFRFAFMVQNIHDSSMELISELKKYETLAQSDALTGILNHGSILAEINNAIDNHARDGIVVSMMMLDLDFFKKVNDTYGHAAGDAVLKTFASILSDFMSEKDASVGRWGGEEFVIVSTGKTGEELKDIADALRKKVEETEFPSIEHITCSIGVTQIKDEDSFEDAFNRMDKAMYLSKENGRNQVTLV